MKQLLLITLLAAFFIGCSTTETRRDTKGIDNVREVPGNYLMYEIEKGTVTCREHKQRAELTCWKK